MLGREQMPRSSAAHLNVSRPEDHRVRLLHLRKVGPALEAAAEHRLVLVRNVDEEGHVLDQLLALVHGYTQLDVPHARREEQPEEPAQSTPRVQVIGARLSTAGWQGAHHHAQGQRRDRAEAGPGTGAAAAAMLRRGGQASPHLL